MSGYEGNAVTVEVSAPGYVTRTLDAPLTPALASVRVDLDHAGPDGTPIPPPVGNLMPPPGKGN